MTIAAIAYPCLLVAGAGLSVWYVLRTRSTVACAALVYALVAISLNFASIWTHVGNGQRGTFELFVVLAVLAVTTPHGPRLRWARATFWVAAAAYIAVGSFQSAAIRHAIAALVW
jgi:hypothetical protein